MCSLPGNPGSAAPALAEQLVQSQNLNKSKSAAVSSALLSGGCPFGSLLWCLPQVRIFCCVEAPLSYWKSTCHVETGHSGQEVGITTSYPLRGRHRGGSAGKTLRSNPAFEEG